MFSFYLSTSGLLLGWLASACLRNDQSTFVPGTPPSCKVCDGVLVSSFECSPFGGDLWSPWRSLGCDLLSILCLFAFKKLSRSSCAFRKRFLSWLTGALASKFAKHLFQISFTSWSLSTGTGVSMAAWWLKAVSIIRIASLAVGEAVHFRTAASSIWISELAQTSG